MDTSKEYKDLLQKELDASKAALKAHNEGIKIHKVVVAAFEKEIENISDEK